MPFARARKSKAPLDAVGLLEYAVKSLASKMKSERDLRRLMARRAAEGEDGQRDMDAVIAKLKELGYLSDERFAADYTRMRQENQKFGRRRVQQGLAQKGVPAALANTALSNAYDDLDETALARQYIERKRMKPPAGDREQKAKDTARVMRRLVAAGFSSGAVWKVLRDWAGSDVQEIDVMDEGV